MKRVASAARQSQAWDCHGLVAFATLPRAEHPRNDGMGYDAHRQS